MAIYKSGRVYYYHFLFNGRHIQESTKQGNPRVARQMEAAHRTSLARGEVGIRERKQIALRDFRYYQYGAETLRESTLGELNLAQITDQNARQYAAKKSALSPSTINCGLRTLRRALNLAYQWGKLDRMPKISLAKGEKQRERVLSDVEVRLYLEACAQPWKDAAVVMLGTGLRPSEVLSLRWERIHLNGTGGMLQIAEDFLRRVSPAIWIGTRLRLITVGHWH
jgi:integrase